MHRVFLAALAVTGSLLMSGDVLACSLSGSKLFRPTLERWDQHPGPAQEDPESKGDFWEKVPAPAVRVVGITRGRSDDGSSCEDAGTVSFEISLPEESTYTIDEFAFYFRVSGRQEPDEIFPSVPVLGVVEGRGVLGHQRPDDRAIDSVSGQSGKGRGPGWPSTLEHDRVTPHRFGA